MSAHLAGQGLGCVGRGVRACLRTPAVRAVRAGHKAGIVGAARSDIEVDDAARAQWRERQQLLQILDGLCEVDPLQLHLALALALALADGDYDVGRLDVMAHEHQLRDEQEPDRGRFERRWRARVRGSDRAAACAAQGSPQGGYFSGGLAPLAKGHVSRPVAATGALKSNLMVAGAPVGPAASIPAPGKGPLRRANCVAERRDRERHFGQCPDCARAVPGQHEGLVGIANVGDRLAALRQHRFPDRRRQRLAAGGERGGVERSPGPQHGLGLG